VGQGLRHTAAERPLARGARARASLSWPAPAHVSYAGNAVLLLLYQKKICGQLVRLAVVFLYLLLTCIYLSASSPKHHFLTPKLGLGRPSSHRSKSPWGHRVTHYHHPSFIPSAHSWFTRSHTLSSHLDLIPSSLFFFCCVLYHEVVVFTLRYRVDVHSYTLCYFYHPSPSLVLLPRATPLVVSLLLHPLCCYHR
jgi:hypothetical protein